jgi:hypothetical protein
MFQDHLHSYDLLTFAPTCSGILHLNKSHVMLTEKRKGYFVRRFRDVSQPRKEGQRTFSGVIMLLSLGELGVDLLQSRIHGYNFWVRVSFQQYIL